MPELTAPLVFKNEEKRIVYGPVLVPNEPDTDNDTVTAEQIEEVAHKFVEDYGNIDLQHSLNNVGNMIESYVMPMDWQVDDDTMVPKGSWMLGVRVTDDNAWQAVKDQKLGGFSIMAINKVAMKSAETTAEKIAAQKRTTLADLKDGWLVNAVSLVDEPAVPKAKFIAIKSKAKKKQQDEITEEIVQKAISGSLEHRKQLVRSKVYQTFDSERTDSYVHSTLDDSVIVRIEDYVTSQRKMYQIGYDIDEQGNVTFSSQPQEVTIQESVVPVSEGDDPLSILSAGGVSLNSKDETDIKTSEKSGEEEGVFAKLFKKLSFRSSEKAGRTISDANLNKLKAAKEVIDELLSIGEKERQSNKSAEGGQEEMDEKQVQDLIKKEMQPIDDKLNELMETFKSGGQEQQEETSQEEAEKSKDEKDTKEDKAEKEKEGKDQEEQQETVSKSEYDKIVAELEKVKKNRPFSKRLAGQDNLTAEKCEEAEPDRNAFGYKISK